MSKHVEITMSSGAKYYLVSTDENKFSRQDIDYMISGADSVSIKVFTESSSTSPQVYINPRRIESFKLIF
ncbi:hypothetical protein [Staphylococcus virus vB_SurM-PSU5]|nr:hypothetical protein [Staphylococcus virus vB_SurM-PSU5]